MTMLIVTGIASDLTAAIQALCTAGKQIHIIVEPRKGYWIIQHTT